MTAKIHLGLPTLSCVLILLMVSTASAQVTWYVDDDAPNDPGPGGSLVSDPGENGSLMHPFDAIQEAVDVAANGDEILVADGTYIGDGNRGIDFGGKDLALHSENGALFCVMDCDEASRGFHFHGGETSAAVVEGFTIINGYLGQGGAIKCESSSSPTIRNCIMSDCYADYYGGGFFADGSDPICINCVIADNYADRNGGGVFCAESAATFVNCTIARNVAHDWGGGIHIEAASDVVFQNCIIAWNGANEGRNVSLGGEDNPSSLTLARGCVPGGNAAMHIVGDCTVVWEGGAFGEDPLFADDDSGDYHLLPASLCIDRGTNAAVSSLSDYDVDGALRVVDGDGDVESWNGVSASVDLGAYEYGVAAGPAICVTPVQLFFETDSLETAPADQVLSIQNCGDGTLNWQIVEACSWLSVDTNSGASTGEIDEVSVSVDTSGLGVGEYTCTLEILDSQAATAPRYVPVRFTVVSPVMCASPGTLRFAGEVDGPNPEALQLSISNCGVGTMQWEIVEECAWLSVTPSSGESTEEMDTVSVSVDTSGLVGGVHECTLEITAPGVANAPQTITVVLSLGETRFVPAEYATIQAAIDAANSGDSVVVADGTYFGTGNHDLDYGGKNIIVRSENGPEHCALSCERDGRGVYFHSGESTGAVFEGFKVVWGQNDRGGAIKCEGECSPTIINCILTSNYANYFGGGLWITDGPNVTMIDCIVSENTAYGCYGGGILCENAALNLVNCLIAENYTPYYGGGLYAAADANVTLTNCTVVRNEALEVGGGIYSYTGSSVTIVNSIIANNTAGNGVEGIVRGTVYVAYSCIPGGQTALLLGGGTRIWGDGNIEVDPGFVDVDDYRLVPGSPCVDAGTNTAGLALPANDLSGNPRLVDGDGNVESWSGGAVTVDVGAYELSEDDTAAICVSADDLTFEAAINEQNPLAQTVSIANCGLGTMNWQITETSPWFTVTPTSGESSGEADEVTVNVDIAGLSSGNYTHFIVVTAPNAVNSPIYVVVHLSVLRPEICALPESLQFVARQDEPNPSGQTISISNCGAGTLDWEIAEDCSWLSVSPASGESTGETDEATVSVDTTGLEPGVHQCTLEITEPDAENSPQEITVELVLNGTLHVPEQYATIQAAIDAALDTDVILIADGTYTGEGNRGIDLGGKELIVRSAGGAQSCVIDCESADRGFHFHCGESNAAVVEGLTILNGYSGEGGAIKCEASSDPMIRNCIMIACQSESNGGGLCALSSDPVCINCVIADNESGEYGGGFYCYRSAAGFSNCTIAGNSATDVGGGIAIQTSSDILIENSVIADNSAPEGPDVSLAGTTNPSDLAVSYSCVAGGEVAVRVLEGCTLNWGDGMIGDDPLFVDAPNGDYRLLSGSACIDAADNTAVPADTNDADGDGDVTERLPFDLDGMLRFADLQAVTDTGVADPPDYPYVVDMGAFEYQCTGDLDGDGAINLADLQLLLSGYGDTDATYAGGDLDGSGTVDLADLQLLLSAYGQTCP